MSDINIWGGVQTLLDEYAKVENSDNVIILFTTDSLESAAWVSAALELRGVTFTRVWMAPLHDEGFLERLTSALPAPNELIGKLIVLSFERDTMSHTSVLSRALSIYKKEQITVLRAISASSSLFTSALSVVPDDLSARNTALLERFVTADQLRIKTSGGSDLRVKINPDYRWISNRGSTPAGGIVILPAGEVATFPALIEGVFVADFAFNINAITDRDARLQKHPVSVWIENSRAIDFECDDLSTSKFLEECFHQYCAFNVGELGFGTNFGVSDAISMNSHINERRPGIHLGFGQHNQDPDLVPYQCSIHLDLIAKGGRVWVDDERNPLDLENIIPSRATHPIEVRAEDVFSPDAGENGIDDCCGILTRDGLDLFAQNPS